VARGKEADKERAFVGKRAITLPVYVLAGEPPEGFRTRGIPATFVVDRAGTVALRHIGAADPAAVLEANGRLRAQRVLVLERDGATIRMAPPFSGVRTQHRVEAGGVGYWANCAWEALGVVAALRAGDFRRDRPGRRVLGSAIGFFGSGGA
jgi:hypothetical protein